MDLRILRSEFGKDAAEAKRFFAKGGTHPIIACGGRIAFVEDEIDDVEHGGNARSEFRSSRNFEGNVLLGQCALGADDTLPDGRFWNQKSAGNFIGGKTPEQPQREGELRLDRQYR